MSEEPADEVMSSIGAKIQTMVQIASEAATTISSRRAEQARVAERQRNDRIRAELDADKLVMRRAFDDRWWQSAELDQIAKTWEVSASWANNGEPYGQVCLDQMREQIKARYGVDVAQVAAPLSRNELTEILGADRDTVKSAAGAAEDSPDAERSVRYVIRDPLTDQELASATEELPGEDRRPIELVAADCLRQYERSRDDHMESGEARRVIDVYDSARPGDEPAYALAAERAESVREEVLQRHERVLAGEELTSPQERLDALLFERQRIRDDLDRLLPADPHLESDRDAPAEHPEPNSAQDQRIEDREPGDADTEDLAPEERIDRVADLQERQAKLGLRIEAAKAELRGENGDHVIEAAALRRGMNEGWWQTASANEVRAMYGHVERWNDGQAKHTMLTQMQADIAHHHGIDVGPNASADMVGQKLLRAHTEGRGEGPAGREADERRDNAANADADAERDAVAGAERARQEEPELAAAENERAVEHRAEAEQERDAAAMLERMEQEDPEAVNAVRGAAKSLRHSLRRRLGDGAAQGENGRRARGSGRVLGPRRATPEVER